MFGPVALMNGKSIQPEGFAGWMTRRIRAFMGTLGLNQDDIIWTDATYPALLALNSLGNFLSASFYLRREILRICWATSGEQDRYSNLFKDIVSLLKATSMTHIVLIDEYLYTRYKELLLIRLLADNNKGMTAAWEYLATLQGHNMYFCKILETKESTACLNRNNFPLHIAAAVAAAKFESPSMVNYRGSDISTRAVNLVGSIVHTYLNRRIKLSATAMINECSVLFMKLHITVPWLSMVSMLLRKKLRSKKEEHQLLRPIFHLDLASKRHFSGA
jgi:hypothetical protein